MAKLEGNIIGDPSGTLGNVVFGKARTREGKVVTMRRWARPTNPQTAGQTIQRTKFADAVWITRDLGPGFYQTDWNRADGQLPGFHSLNGIWLDNLTDAYALTEPAAVPLGTLHVPDSLVIETGPTDGLFTFTWSAEVGDNGAAADDVICFAILSARDANDQHPTVILTPEQTRATSPASLDTGLVGIAHACGCYLRSTLGEPAGLSTCTWFLGNSGTT